MFDSHCHLTDIEGPEQALADARAAGVQSVLCCGYNLESNQLVEALAQRVPTLPYAMGLHPWFANEDVDDTLRIIAACRPTAVGEIGIDLSGNPPRWPAERQIHVLDAQLHCAVRLNLPVSLHCRKGGSVLLSLLRNHPSIRGSVHAFSESPSQVRAFLDLGMYIGVGGAITRSQCVRVRRNALQLPLDRVLLETDSPSMGVGTVVPPHARPAHLVHVRNSLAEVRGASPQHIEAVTDRNASSLFGVVL